METTGGDRSRVRRQRAPRAAACAGGHHQVREDTRSRRPYVRPAAHHHGLHQVFELALKEKKLKAEIALKESQGELHRLKTEIASGKYISVEEVQLDYQRFFVQLKKFVLAIPNRVGGMIGGYADPVTVRGVEKDLSKEVNTMLNAFVVAGKQETVEDSS